MMILMLQYDFTIDDFWNLTIKEINIYIGVFQEKEKKKYEKVYVEAQLISQFVGSMLSGKNIPSIQEVFPEFYKDENEELAEELKDDLAINLYKEQMLDWAMAVNKRNRAKLEGENK